MAALLAILTLESLCQRPRMPGRIDRDGGWHKKGPLLEESSQLASRCSLKSILDTKLPDQVGVHSLAAEIPSLVHHRLNRRHFFGLPLIAPEIKLAKNGEGP